MKKIIFLMSLFAISITNQSIQAMNQDHQNRALSKTTIVYGLCCLLCCYTTSKIFNNTPTLSCVCTPPHLVCKCTHEKTNYNESVRCKHSDGSNFKSVKVKKIPDCIKYYLDLSCFCTDQQLICECVVNQTRLNQKQIAPKMQ